MTQIITTIGPASLSKTVLKGLIEAGADYFRLNFSHGEHPWHKNTIKILREIDKNIPIILDTKGPEMRTGDVDTPIVFKKDNWLTLVTQEEDANPHKRKIFVNHPGLPNDVVVGDILSIDSGLVEVEVLEVQKNSVITKALNGGKISSRRHVNLVGKDVSLPTLTDHDILDIAFGLQNGIDIIALSFIRSAHGILMARDLCQKAGRPEVKIFAKIESQPGLDNLEEIAQEADGLMVARGDLGVETPYELLPYRQKEIIAMGKKHNIPVIVATEMLESMIHHPRPTRAEVSDVSLAVWEGAEMVMLSGETAAGQYPVQCVQVMQKVISAAEENMPQ